MSSSCTDGLDVPRNQYTVGKHSLDGRYSSTLACSNQNPGRKLGSVSVVWSFSVCFGLGHGFLGLVNGFSNFGRFLSWLTFYAHPYSAGDVGVGEKRPCRLRPWHMGRSPSCAGGGPASRSSTMAANAASEMALAALAASYMRSISSYVAAFDRFSHGLPFPCWPANLVESKMTAGIHPVFSGLQSAAPPLHSMCQNGCQALEQGNSWRSRCNGVL